MLLTSAFLWFTVFQPAFGLKPIWRRLSISFRADNRIDVHNPARKEIRTAEPSSRPSVGERTVFRGNTRATCSSEGLLLIFQEVFHVFTSKIKKQLFTPSLLKSLKKQSVIDITLSSLKKRMSHPGDDSLTNESRICG